MSTTPHTADGGQTFTPDPTKPLRLEIVIENSHPDFNAVNPYMLTATANALPGGRVHLYPNRHGVIVIGEPAEQLRALADALDAGEVYL